VLNTVATVCVIDIIRRLLPDQPAMAAAGGLLTAVWFQAPFGTLWFEQTAFAFNLLALAMVIRGKDANGNTAALLRVTAGTLLAASMLSKQNAGGEFVPVLFLVVALPYLRKPREAVWPSIHVSAGLLLGFTFFGLWLWQFSSPATFWHDYVSLARQIKSDRSTSFSQLWWMITRDRRLIGYVVPLMGLLAGWNASRRHIQSAPNAQLIRWIVFSAIVFQLAFAVHTQNDPENAFPFMGLVYGLSFGLLIKVVSASENFTATSFLKTPYGWMVMLCMALPLYNGAWASWTRIVQEFVPHTVFTTPLQVPALSKVKWGEPTLITTPMLRDRTRLAEEDFEALNRWLTAANVNFFVFKDAILLYGVHHRVSPQPWLYLSSGHSFRTDEVGHVDEKIVQSLQRNQVEAIVLEKESFLHDEQDLLMRLPKFRSWMENEFEPVQEFGIYRIFKRRGQAVETATPGQY